jgi:hypothetical protein
LSHAGAEQRADDPGQIALAVIPRAIKTANVNTPGELARLDGALDRRYWRI